MFEKEARYYAFDEVNHKQEWYVKHPELSIDCDYEDIKKHWGKGAEFGYNKANEMNCVKDKLPPENVPLLCVRGGKIYVAWYWDGIYHDDKCRQVKKPYLWKEIVLPELSKEVAQLC